MSTWWLRTCSLLVLAWSALLAQPVQAQKANPGQVVTDAPDSERRPETSSITLGPTKGLAFRSADNRTRLEFHLAAWFRWNLALSNGDTESQIMVPLVRPAVNAFFFDGKVHAFVQPELAGSNPRLLDLFTDTEILPGTMLRLGQFRTPYSRSFISPIIQLLFPDRGMVVDAFRLGRDTGAMLHGKPNHSVFEYYVGLFNGATINNLSNNHPLPMPVVRMVYNIGTPVPYDQVPASRRNHDLGLAFGVDGAYRRRNLTDQISGATAEKESWNTSADVALVAGPVAASAEGFLRYERLVGGSWQRAWGSFIQGGIFVLPQVFELATRVGWIDGGAEGLQQAYGLGVNGYLTVGNQRLGHHLKGSLQYVFTNKEHPVPPMTSHESHEVTLQGQLWF